MASDQTEARRARVKELWIKSDRQIAEILIEEGFGGEQKHTADARRLQLSSMVRNVWNDRAWWRKSWREQKRLTAGEASESRGEHLAALESLKREGIDKLSERSLKGTPFAQTLQAITRIIEATAKMNGVAELEPPDESSKSTAPPVVGLVIGGENLSPEMKKKLQEQGYDFAKDDEKPKRKRRRKPRPS